MSDWTDEASEQQELLDQIALENQRRQAEQHRQALGQATGACLNCEEPLGEGRFCDAECRVDFEKRCRANGMRPR